MENNIFDFNYLNSSIGHDKCMAFYCPICGDIYGAIGLNEYIPHHDFYIGKDFFCSNCMSQYCTVKGGKIKLVSKSLCF